MLLTIKERMRIRSDNRDKDGSVINDTMELLLNAYEEILRNYNKLEYNIEDIIQDDFRYEIPRDLEKLQKKDY